MMKVYKAVHGRENKCKELHKEMNMNAGPTRLVQPDFYLLVDVDDLQKQVNTLENEVHRMKRVEARRKWRYGRKIIKILELVQTKDDGTVEFSEESKKLIHEVAEKCRILPIYQQNKEKVNMYKDGMTAKQVYIDMCFKIVNAPTQIHMMMTPKLILPVIDDLLQAELSESEEEV